METIRIQFTLFSAFYSPLISTMSGGFLKAEGLDPQWSISPPGGSALAALKDGSAHVVQSALSQGFTSLNKGETPAAVHFAQVNEMDGFFLTGREADPAFTWDKLEGAEVVMFNGGQPIAMFKYACHKAGIDFNKIDPSAPAAPPKSTTPSVTARGGMFSSRVRSRSNCKPMASDMSWPKSATRLDHAVFPALRRPATGFKQIWRRRSCAPTRRPGST